MQPIGQLGQLIAGAGQLAERPVQGAGDRLGRGGSSSCILQLGGQGRQSSLRTLPQSSFESLTLLVAGGDEASTRRLDLPHLRTQLGLEAGVRGCEARGSDQGAPQDGVGGQMGTMDEDRDRAPVALDEGRAAVTVVRRQGDGPAVAIHEAVLSRKPEADLQGRVIQQQSQLEGEAAAAAVAQVEHQVCHRRATAGTDELRGEIARRDHETHFQQQAQVDTASTDGDERPGRGEEQDGTEGRAQRRHVQPSRAGGFAIPCPVQPCQSTHQQTGEDRGTPSRGQDGREVCDRDQAPHRR